VTCRAEKVAGLLSFTDMVAIMGTPRHRERLNGHYVSSVTTYAQPFFDKLRVVTRNSPFWDPAPRQSRDAGT
jgi:hypothetical protein